MGNTLFKFRQFKITNWFDLYLFQGGRWELGITLDVNQNHKTKQLYWNTWLLAVNLVFIHLEFHYVKR